MDHIQRARVRAGDPEAFGMLFDDYARAVYNLAFRLTGCPEAVMARVEVSVA